MPSHDKAQMDKATKANIIFVVTVIWTRSSQCFKTRQVPRLLNAFLQSRTQGGTGRLFHGTRDYGLWFMVSFSFLFFFLYFLQNQNLQRWASSQPTFGTCASQRAHKQEPWRRSLGPQIIVRLWRQRWSPFCRLSPPFISAAVTLLCPISSWTTKGFNTYRIGKPQVSGPEPEWEEKWCLFLHLNTW